MRVTAHANVLGYRYGETAEVDPADPEVAAALAGNMLVPVEGDAPEGAALVGTDSGDPLDGLGGDALRDRLRTAGLPTGGKVEDLRDRLRDHLAAEGDTEPEPGDDAEQGDAGDTAEQGTDDGADAGTVEPPPE